MNLASAWEHYFNDAHSTQVAFIIKPIRLPSNSSISISFYHLLSPWDAFKELLLHFVELFCIQISLILYTTLSSLYGDIEANQFINISRAEGAFDMVSMVLRYAFVSAIILMLRMINCILNAIIMFSRRFILQCILSGTYHLLGCFIILLIMQAIYFLFNLPASSFGHTISSPRLFFENAFINIDYNW